MKPNVLIVEDDFIQAANLAEVVQQDLDAEPLAVASVTEALQVIPDNTDLAILDIELVDGKSYPVARKLIDNEIPVIFVSANARAFLPDDLKDIPFLANRSSPAHWCACPGNSPTPLPRAMLIEERAQR
ncbi:MAG TPA: response regulator [Aestuariivirga sp.]|nr:response regulator [Aestuariivirga sp.]